MTASSLAACAGVKPFGRVVYGDMPILLGAADNGADMPVP